MKFNKIFNTVVILFVMCVCIKGINFVSNKIEYRNTVPVDAIQYAVDKMKTDPDFANATDKEKAAFLQVYIKTLEKENEK